MKGVTNMSSAGQPWEKRAVAQERACVRCKAVKSRDAFGHRERVCQECKESPLKFCTTCGERKPEAEFWKQRAKCMDCVKQYSHAAHAKKVGKREKIKSSHPDYIAPDAPKALPEEPPRVFNILPAPWERANNRGELRSVPQKPSSIPKFAPKGTYSIAHFWVEFPEAHHAWYEVLREDGLPASDKRFVHPMNDR